MLGKFAKGAAQASRSGNRTLSIIGNDVHIVGNISTAGEMQIDGRVDGDIRCGTLIVGESAHLTGEIIADTVRVHGALTGRITAQTVVIARSANVVGDIVHDSLQIDAGAKLEGRLLRKEDDALAQTQTPAIQEAPKPLALPDQSAQIVARVKPQMSPEAEKREIQSFDETSRESDGSLPTTPQIQPA